MGAGGIWKLSVPSLHLSCEPKTALKESLNLKKFFFLNALVPGSTGRVPEAMSKADFWRPLCRQARIPASPATNWIIRFKLI